jgi:autotransporter-associated beta strand protein
MESWRFMANDVTPETNFVCVGFNGGTIKARSNGYSIFGSITTSDGVGPSTVVRVYEKGGAVDTAGHKEIFSDAPIKAAEGGGVASIPWTPRTGCQYPPLVLIRGDGYGASALAEFDSRSGTVTGVTVTSPGCGYTYAKAEFIFGYEGTDKSIIALTNDCVIAQNNGKGSFTKKGEGKLTLRAENTWGGDTILAGGVLKSGIDGAISANGTFVLAGGTLDMNGTTLSDGTAMPRKWAVDVRTALENGTVAYDGDLAFPEGATLDLRGEEILTDSDSNMTLLSVTGTVTGAPSLPELDNPRWKAWWRGGSIRLTKSYGTTVVFR